MLEARCGYTPSTCAESNRDPRFKHPKFVFFSAHYRGKTFVESGKLKDFRKLFAL